MVPAILATGSIHPLSTITSIRASKRPRAGDEREAHRSEANLLAPATTDAMGNTQVVATVVTPSSSSTQSSNTQVEVRAPSAAAAGPGSNKKGRAASAAAPPGSSGGQEKPVCAICQDPIVAGVPATRFPVCRHMFHRRCIECYAESCVRQRKVPVPCPMVPWDGACLADAQAYGHLKPGSQETYDRVKEELEVANDENRHFCRTPGCRGILTVTVEQVQVALSREEDGGGAGRTGVVCGQCGQELRLSLSEQDREFEALALREGYKQCPKCGAYIHYEGGCKKMTCHCLAHFCVECGKPKEAKCSCESKLHSYLPRPMGPSQSGAGLPLADMDVLFARPHWELAAADAAGEGKPAGAPSSASRTTRRGSSGSSSGSSSSSLGSRLMQGALFKRSRQGLKAEEESGH